MTLDFMGPRRLEPLHGGAVQVDAEPDTQQNNALQQDADAADNVQAYADAPPEDYTISVEHVREHFRRKGLTKSKDTVQRWCRIGDLDCQKLGLLGRYFTTETSLLKLERKLLPDMIAENAGAAVVPVDAAADEAASTEMPLHAPEDEPASNDMQVDEDDVAAARSDAPAQPAVKPLHAGEELASLRAENAGLKEQLSEAKDNATFLREEIISARGQRGDVVKIAEQMLGTLETIAIGERLERPRRQGSEPAHSTDPIRYDEQNPAVHDV